MKYDAINRDILGHFASKLDVGINRFYNEVNKAREKLESMAMEGAHTSDSIAYIGMVQVNKKRVPELTELFEAYASAEKLLERQRFPFPSNWLRVEQVEGEWDAFRSILNRRDAAVSGQVANLQMSVVNEERQLETQLAALVVDWDKNKPMGGDVNPDEAVNLLNIFEGRFMRLKDDQDNLIRAKTALDLDVKEDQRLSTRIDELHELKSSWAELSRVVSKMSELKSTEWGAVVPTKVRSTLNKIVEEMKKMPARVKSYQAYEHLLEQARAYLKVNETIAVLRGDALKSRHWKMLTRNLGVHWDMAILTLGQVWAVDLQANEETVNEVLLQAQGEKALEEFLKQIKETWQSYELELVNYQNKTKLIKGWDDLFTQAKDHITNLAQMKMSPYYKVFEEEATAWDQKLNTLYTLFCDVWIDVQRQWVYLDGIFTGSADLKALLPTETNKFTSLSSEFIGLMRKVSKNPLVLEVLALQNLQRTLDHLKDVLDKIQKALSKYLEQVCGKRLACVGRA
jgi:dynein heavy chain 1